MKIIKKKIVTTSMPAIDPPILKSPVITHAIIKVSKEAVILQVIVFNSDLFYCSAFIIKNNFLKYF